MTSRSSLVALRPFFSCPRFFYAYFVSLDLSMDPVQSFQVQTPRAPSCGVRSAQRVLDQYLCVFAIQGVCLRSILFCSLLTFTQQINTHIGQGGVVCSAGDLSRHAGALTRKRILDQYLCVLAVYGVCSFSTSLQPIDYYTQRNTQAGWGELLALQGFCLGHAGALTQTISPRLRPAQHAA